MKEPGQEHDFGAEVRAAAKLAFDAVAIATKEPALIVMALAYATSVAHTSLIEADHPLDRVLLFQAISKTLESYTQLVVRGGHEEGHA